MENKSIKAHLALVFALLLLYTGAGAALAQTPEAAVVAAASSSLVPHRPAPARWTKPSPSGPVLSLLPGTAEHQLGRFLRLRRLDAELVLGGPGEKLQTQRTGDPT